MFQQHKIYCHLLWLQQRIIEGIEISSLLVHLHVESIRQETLQT